MIKVSSEADKVCVAKANEAGQGHVFSGWKDLSPEDQRNLIDELQSTDFQLVNGLIRQYLNGAEHELGKRLLKPPAVEKRPASRENVSRYDEFDEAGSETLRAGKVALVMLSGGPGIGPLGEPTGMLPVGPVTGKCLFQLHAEKIHALNRRYRVTLPWFIVTHPSNQKMVRDYFREQNYFGLPPSSLTFMPQPLLPLVDKRGKFLITEPGHLALAPNGHGGVLLELLKKEHMERFAALGAEHIFYFQVDNPLVRIPDPLFVGYHILSQAEVTSKAVPKLAPDEEVGIFCQWDGATGVVEYSELGAEDRELTSPDGCLAFANGNIAIHLFSMAFLRRMTEETIQLPFHMIRRTVPFLNKRNKRVRPTEPNAVEFCFYLFDALWKAKRSRILEVRRQDEFSPIKHTGGDNSPQTAQRDLSSLYASWLKNSGATFSAEANDSLPAIEVSPLFALDEEELREKIELPYAVEGDTLLTG